MMPLTGGWAKRWGSIAFCSPRFALGTGLLGNGLVENEYDHVLVGSFAGRPVPNPQEVAEWRWAAVDDVSDDQVARPTLYSVWFRIAVQRFQVRGW